MPLTLTEMLNPRSTSPEAEAGWRAIWDFVHAHCPDMRAVGEGAKDGKPALRVTFRGDIPHGLPSELQVGDQVFPVVGAKGGGDVVPL